MACDQIIDSYEGSDDTGAFFQCVGCYIGQAFTMGVTARDICGAKFNVDVVDNGGGISIDAVVKIYACTGTPGTDGMITGGALATSDTIRFSTPQTTWTTFTFATPYTLNALTNYCIVCACAAVNGNMIMGPTADSSSPTHGGNSCFDLFGFLDDYNTNDTNFYIYYAGPDVGYSITIMQDEVQHTIESSSEQQHNINPSGESQHNITTSYESQHIIEIITDEE